MLCPSGVRPLQCTAPRARALGRLAASPAPPSGLALTRHSRALPDWPGLLPPPRRPPVDAPGASALRSHGPLTEPVTRLMGLLTFGWKALAPSACGRDLTRKQGDCPGHVMRRLLRWPLVQYDCVLMKKENSDTETEGTQAGRPVTVMAVRRASLLRTGRPCLAGTVRRRRVSSEHTAATPRGPLFNRLSVRGHSPADLRAPESATRRALGTARPGKATGEGHRRSSHPRGSPHL